MTAKESDHSNDVSESDSGDDQERKDTAKSRLASTYAKLKTTASKAGENTISGVSAVAGVVKVSASTAGKVVTDRAVSAGSVVKETASTAGKVVSESAVGQVASRTSEEVGKHLDTVSGAGILKLVEERLELQSRYNDVLATKLNEALARIEQLERAVSSIDDQQSGS